MTPPAYTDRTEAWLAGQLTPAELQAFEQDRRDNPALEAHCQYLLHLGKAQEDASTAQFAAMLQGIEGKLHAEDFFEEKIPAVLPAPAGRKALILAAAVLAVLVAAVVWWLVGQSQQADKAQQILRTTTLPQAAAQPSIRLGAAPSGRLAARRDSLLQLLQSGQYPAAAEGWRAEYSKDPEEPQARFYWAIAQIKAEHADPQHPPLSLLNSLHEEQEKDPGAFHGVFQTDDLRWYLALTLLSAGQPDEAKVLLKKISSGARQQEAAALLQAIH